MDVLLSFHQATLTAGCGETIGCLRYKSGCSGSDDCEYVATYSYQPATKIVTFELFGKNAEWVAIGFSDDKEMVRENIHVTINKWYKIC